jgi:molybdopterin-synthase adenylyltransferase
VKSVVIIGAGALGSHLVLLARNWREPLVVVDFDHVERRNVDSQFHTLMSLRQTKTLSLQRSMQGLFGFRFEVLPRKLESHNVEALLRGASLIIDCTDNIEARQLIQGFARERSLPCLHGALSAGGDFGMAVWTEDFIPDAEGHAGQATCENGDRLPFYAMAAAQLALTAQAFLTTGVKRSYQFTAHNVLRVG